jgi:hypothetical protein
MLWIMRLASRPSPSTSFALMRSRPIRLADSTVGDDRAMPDDRGADKLGPDRCSEAIYPPGPSCLSRAQWSGALTARDSLIAELERLLEEARRGQRAPAGAVPQRQALRAPGPDGWGKKGHGTQSCQRLSGP